MEFHQLEYLVAIAEEKTISKASERLLISQPALTRSIQKLEEELGFPLFDRVKNRLILNDTGELAVAYAKTILENREKMITILTNHENNKKSINFGSCAPAPLWGINYILGSNYEENQIHSILDGDRDFLMEQFSHKALRFIILDYPIQQKGIVSKLLFVEQLYLAVKEDHPFANKESLTFEELNGTTILSRSKTGYWAELCQSNLPDSLILIQEDEIAYRALMQASSLAVFRSNLTVLSSKSIEDRIYIPIQGATVSFYGIFNENDDELINFIENNAQTIEWKQFNTEKID